MRSGTSVFMVPPPQQLSQRPSCLLWHGPLSQPSALRLFRSPHISWGRLCPSLCQVRPAPACPGVLSRGLAGLLRGAHLLQSPGCGKKLTFLLGLRKKNEPRQPRAQDGGVGPLLCSVTWGSLGVREPVLMTPQHGLHWRPCSVSCPLPSSPSRPAQGSSRTGPPAHGSPRHTCDLLPGYTWTVRGLVCLPLGEDKSLAGGRVAQSR